jgi:hypothetical protein
MTTLASERRVYEITTTIADVVGEIRVNDVPVLRVPTGRVETAFDVNPYVVTGTNTLSLILRPPAIRGVFSAAANAEVKLSEKRAPDEAEGTPVVALAWKTPEVFPTGFDDAAGPVDARHAGLSASRTFTLKTPFAPWFWTRAAQLEATEAVRVDVLAKYYEIWDQLKKRDVNALVRACGEQARDYQDAYYLPNRSAAERFLGIAKTLSDPDVIVEDFPESLLTMEILGGGKLVQLVDAEGKSPLRLRVKSLKNVVGRFNVVLCLAESKWVIAR